MVQLLYNMLVDSCHTAIVRKIVNVALDHSERFYSSSALNVPLALFEQFIP